ncbi:MAG: tRNA-(ms[2]io[6]A)-hydroxylase [Deltaproteobacteria bacterium]|nr:tRNA-(ms[2]io[6]A)-hydroxylase [Deltaproteobacteria bacterium]
MSAEVQPLRWATPREWTEIAGRDMAAVLQDHAHLEKKAAASAMSLVSAYPEHDQLVRRCVRLAREELQHFQQVHALLLARGLPLGKDGGDPYARALLEEVRHPRDQRLLDRLLVFSLIEARSGERLALLGETLEDEELRAFYAGLAKVEAGHFRLFVELAESLFEPARVAERLEVLAAREAEIAAALPLRPRLH